MIFQKNKTLKAEKAVRSGDNQAGLEMPVFQSTPMWPSWDSSPPALLWTEAKRRVAKQREVHLEMASISSCLFLGWSFKDAY